MCDLLVVVTFVQEAVSLHTMANSLTDFDDFTEPTSSGSESEQTTLTTVELKIDLSTSHWHDDVMPPPQNY